jgi:hypothetical protein
MLGLALSLTRRAEPKTQVENARSRLHKQISVPETAIATEHDLRCDTNIGTSRYCNLVGLETSLSLEIRHLGLIVRERLSQVGQVC